MTASRTRRRRPRLTVILVLLLLVPVVEIAVIVAVGRAIGGWQTLALLVLESALGAWLVRREGGRAWRTLSTALRSGRMPSRELADAALVLVGGILLLMPGFVSDLAGFLCILPFTRPLGRRLLEAAVARRLLGGLLRPPRGPDGPGPGSPVQGGPGGPIQGGPGQGRPGPDVIEGEIL